MKNIFKTASKKAKDFVKDFKKLGRSAKKKFLRKFQKENKTKKTPSSFKEGNFLFFKYNAIHEEHKFDKNPLIICLGKSRQNQKHILGLNVHWMPENQRVLLASLISEIKKKNNGRVVYEDIKPLIKRFEGSPILRRYAIRRISNTILQMDDNEYLAAASISFPEWSQISER